MAGFIASFKIADHAAAIPGGFYVPKHVEATIPSGNMAVAFDVFASQASYDAGDKPIDGFGCTVDLSSPAALLGAVFGDIVAAVAGSKIPQIDPAAVVVP
jgi:hypothetical protein